MVTVDDRVAWLLDQIGEDERILKAADDDRIGRMARAGRTVVADAGMLQEFTRARLLREVEAKRKRIELHQPANPDDEPREGLPGWPDEPWLYCRTCGSGEAYSYPTDWPCDTLKLEAAPYADRPGYRKWTSTTADET